MAKSGKAKIGRITTGIPRLDGVLGGGFPDRSLNIIAGGPGTGKSIFTLQILFHQASLGNKSILFITISEPAIKFLRYVQQFAFFDTRLFPDTVAFFDVSDQVKARDVTACIEAIRREVDAKEPSVIVIDSFNAMRDQFEDPTAARAIIYDLLVDFSVRGVTTFLVGEYDTYEASHLPEFFAADSIVSLSMAIEGVRPVRRLEVLKLRGSSFIAGVHFFDITSAGVVVYPRVRVPHELELELKPEGVRRLATGVPGLDQMLEGGIPARSTTLVQGGTGTGKTLLSLSFLVQGARSGEPGLIFTLEETREQLIEIGASRGWPLEQMEKQGLLRIVYTAPIELAGDVLLQIVQDSIEQVGAKRAVIDSIASLKLSITGEGRTTELLYALGKTFRMKGVTTIVTNEVPELLGSGALLGYGFSYTVDNTILLRYVEIESRLTMAISVLKVRGSGHDSTLRELRITGDSIEVSEPFEEFRGVITGLPMPGSSKQDSRRKRRPDATRG